MMSNGKQFTVTREMLTAIARVPRWPGVVAGISTRFSKFAFVLFCYITTGPSGSSEFSLNVFLESHIEILGETKFTVPLGTSH